MTDDMFPVKPEPPTTTQYTKAFESCWKVHRVGNKKKAFNAGTKAGFTDAQWLWLENYLKKRHKDDARWIEGRYVPHLSTIINEERWDDAYVRVRGRSGFSDEGFSETPEQAQQKIAAAQAAFERAAEQRENRRVH